MKVTREDLAYLRRRIAPLDTDTRRRQSLHLPLELLNRPKSPDKTSRAST